MAQVKCARGHIYNTDQYASCPICNGSARSIDFIEGNSTDVGKTVAGGMGYVATGGVMKGVADTIGPTVPNAGIAVAEDIPATKPAMRTGGREPVVGFLICVNGKEKGKDYRLFGRMNTIGSDKKNDVVIKGDETISHQNQVQIGYDPRSNMFTVVKGDGKNLNYLNGKPIYSEAELAPYDRLEIGKTSFLFLPFCGENFRWEEDKE